ncbi:hypothetical protein RUM44_013767 [Polyplax serrata]|uniref:Uncharacterized protein n=1 Tax=Polyplax serrata TaxID=468196 RepID=A0ABR1BIM5_POLSC
MHIDAVQDGNLGLLSPLASRPHTCREIHRALSNLKGNSKIAVVEQETPAKDPTGFLRLALIQPKTKGNLDEPFGLSACSGLLQMREHTAFDVSSGWNNLTRKWSQAHAV